MSSWIASRTKVITNTAGGRSPSAARWRNWRMNSWLMLIAAIDLPVPGCHLIRQRW